MTVQVEEGRVATPSFALKPLTETTTLTGKVSDKKTGNPLAATVSFPDAGLAAVSTDPATGVYKTELPVGSYAVKVMSEGYIDQTAAVILQKDKPLIRDFELVKEGMAITLRGIYFDYNKATIKPESHPALADAAKILQENPGIKVEIQGHTDSDGSESYNQQLSERRAQSVVTYLIQNFAIDPTRLTAKGYGEMNPVASNSTPEGKALNRRVEFVILKSGQ
jgi:outer membrane protein OmpA-like peptidoglycan-associated protein